MGRESTRKVLTLRARAQSRPPREIHYSHCHTTFPFWMDFDSSVRKTIIKRVFALYANFASLGLNVTHHLGCFFVHVPKWMVKSTNMSSFLPFLQHPDMKKKFQDALYLYYCSRKFLQSKKWTAKFSMKVMKISICSYLYPPSVYDN